MGHYIVRYFERQARKTAGPICCGGLITSIALDCGVNVEGFIPDMGEMSLNLDILKHGSVIAVDSDYQGFFLQRRGDHFPFPDPINTYVSGWNYRPNWKMNEEVHQRRIAEKRPVGQWMSRYHPDTPLQMPVPERPPSPPPQLQPPPQQDEAGPCNVRCTRRRRPRQEEEEDISIPQRLDHLEANLAQFHTQLNTRLDGFENRLDVFEGYHRSEAERMDWFDHMLTSMYDRFNTWNLYPPPPPPSQ